MPHSLESLTDSLLASYKRSGGINHVDGKNLPSKDAIEEITVDLLRLVFPGFFDPKLVHSSELRSITACRLERVLPRLENEIRKSLEYAACIELPEVDVPGRARELAMQFLKSLPGVRDLLQTDIDAAYIGDPAACSPEEVIVAYPF